MPQKINILYSLLNVENVAFIAYLVKTYSIIARDTRQSLSKNGLDLDKQHFKNTDDHCVSTRKYIYVALSLNVSMKYI